MNEMVFLAISLLFCCIILLLREIFSFGRNARGFDRTGTHKNGTRFDDEGYDVDGFDKNGYNKSGFDIRGYDIRGFNVNGYNIDGKNESGKYNRFHDLREYFDGSEYSKDGFLNPKIYPISITTHARERIRERSHISGVVEEDDLVLNAYAYGKSARQIMKSSALLLRDVESRHENNVALIYRGYIYIFSDDNTLITMYENERIII